MEGLELQEQGLLALGRVHQLGNMYQFTKSRFSRVSLIFFSISGCLFLFFSWWVQTTFKISNLDSKFDAEKIIREVEIQSGGYTVSGMRNLFKLNQSKKISTISLNQMRTTSGDSLHAKTFDSVSVQVWIGVNPKEPTRYACRFSDANELIISRIYLEGALQN
jgi:hypothetical protein